MEMILITILDLRTHQTAREEVPFTVQSFMEIAKRNNVDLISFSKEEVLKLAKNPLLAKQIAGAMRSIGERE
jgi:hypothetical protein